MSDSSVVICAYTEERWNELIATIESVQCQTLPPNEIIVVIDHNPQLLKRVQEHILDVIVVENTETYGLSGARNSGIATARSHIVAFLDDVSFRREIFEVVGGFRHEIGRVGIRPLGC